MAQGDRFEMAIAYPIMNPKFSLKNRVTGTLDTAYVVGTTLSTNGVDTDQGSTTLSFLDLVFKANDRIVVGPSSNSININKSESVVINHTTGDNFTLNNTLSFKYEIDDKFSGIGSALAGGWFFTGIITANSTADIVLGNFDNYAQEFATVNHVAGTGELRQNLDTSFLVDSVLYRIGFVYKFTNASIGSLAAFSLDMDGDIISLSIDTLTSFTTEINLLTKIWTSSPYMSFRLTKPGLNANAKLTAVIDEVFMEHTFGDLIGKRTEIPTTNTGFENGYYLFDEDYDFNSIKIRKRKTLEILKFNDKKKVMFDPTDEGDRIEKYSFACKFSDVRQSFYDILLEFDRLQKSGNTINIHPNIDNLPSVMRGKFIISGVEKNSWDLSLTSFDFQFEEA